MVARIHRDQAPIRAPTRMKVALLLRHHPGWAKEACYNGFLFVIEVEKICGAFVQPVRQGVRQQPTPPWPQGRMTVTNQYVLPENSGASMTVLVKMEVFASVSMGRVKQNCLIIDPPIMRDMRLIGCQIPVFTRRIRRNQPHPSAILPLPDMEHHDPAARRTRWRDTVGRNVGRFHAGKQGRPATGQ